jgi:SAM-dependent methyltransferase
MPDWGEIFADPKMQRLKPNPEVMALAPRWRAAGCRRVLDAGCGVGRHLLPLAAAGFQVWGVDLEASALKALQKRLDRELTPSWGEGQETRDLPWQTGYGGLGGEMEGRAGEGGTGVSPVLLSNLPHLVRADLRGLPFAGPRFDLVLSVNVINHGDAAAFREYCREIHRVLKAGGHLFIYVSPREFGGLVRLPQTRELEPGTLVDIATPDGALVHHFPTPEELQAQFPHYRLNRLEIIRAPIPFMGDARLPQLLFWGEKLG